MNSKRLEWDFTYHAPTPNNVMTFGEIRTQAHEFAKTINDLVPDCREKSLAITKLEEVVSWANAALARQDRPDDAK